jgi:hypothetical protein
MSKDELRNVNLWKAFKKKKKVKKKVFIKEFVSFSGSITINAVLK